MAESITTGEMMIRRGTPHAGLAALGLRLRQLDLFRPIREQVRPLSDVASAGTY